MEDDNHQKPTWSVKHLRSLVASHRSMDDISSSRIGSVIRLKRPSIPIDNGTFEVGALKDFVEDPSESTALPLDAGQYKKIVEDYSGSVGRVEVKAEDGDFHPIGTCFLVSKHGSVRMATAGHLLKSILGPQNGINNSKPVGPEHAMRDVRVNFHDKGDDDPTQTFTVRKPLVWAHPRWDLLLFDLDTTPDELGNRLPLPLETDTEWWPIAERNKICILGYPMNRGTGSTQVFNLIFKETLPLGIKRISPGYCDQPLVQTPPPPEEVEDVSTIERDKSTLDHDASTLAGSSGSPVFSLESKKVIGLHYDGGEFQRSRSRPPTDPNNAVNMPVALLESELLATITDAPSSGISHDAINWNPAIPSWSGAGLLEQNDQKDSAFLPEPGNIVLKSVVADRPDFRDRIYRSSLLKAGDELTPSNKGDRFIRNQADVPACTAYAVAAAINVQLQELGRTNEAVSEQMLYSMATLHDEWIDDSKGGSSLRGAIKGFYQNGVCLESAAPLPTRELNWSLSRAAALQARSITLGAYYRLRPDLLNFQLALNEARAIVVSARIHSGWTSRKSLKTGKIAPRGKHMGSHAFVILGYVEDGFIIQNSWGEQWSTWNGHPGLAHWHYDDWAENLIDAWVLRLAPSTPNAFDLVPKIASQYQLLQSDTTQTIQLPALPRPRRFSLIGHVCQFERDRFSIDGRLGIGLESLRETALFLSTDAARKKYPTIAFFFHDPMLGRENIGKLCAWMIKPFKRHGIYPIHIVYGVDESRTIELRVKHECMEIRSRFGSVDENLSVYIERRLSQLMHPLIKVFTEGIKETAHPGNPLWQALASITLECGEDRRYAAFASGSGYCLVEQLAALIRSSKGKSNHNYVDSGARLFEQKLSRLFLLAPSATLDMIEGLDIADKTSICTLADAYEPSSELPGYYGDWIDLAVRVTGLDNSGRAAVRLGKSEHKLILDRAKSSTLHEASAEVDVMNQCLKMFTEKTYKKKYAFE